MYKCPLYYTISEIYFFCHLSVGENIETNEDIANDNTIADTSSSSSEGIVLVLTACLHLLLPMKIYHWQFQNFHTGGMGGQFVLYFYNIFFNRGPVHVPPRSPCKIAYEIYILKFNFHCLTPTLFYSLA